MNRSAASVLLVFSFIFGIIFFAHPAVALDIPVLKGRVNDTASLLSPQTIQLLEQQLQQLEEEDSTQVVVLTIPSLKGESLEEYSIRVAETWEIGQQDADNGALLLIAVNDRKLRIEVGYGLEGLLTDLVAGRIVDNVIVPRFKRGQFDQGVIDGVAEMIKTVKGQFDSEAIAQKKPDPEGLIIAGLCGLFFIGAMLRKHKLAASLAGGVYGGILALVHPLVNGTAATVLCIIIGLLGSWIISLLTKSSSVGRRSGSGPYFSSGGFSSGGRFGGFSGGGGGFGGGGASGGW